VSEERRQNENGGDAGDEHVTPDRFRDAGAPGPEDDEAASGSAAPYELNEPARDPEPEVKPAPAPPREQPRAETQQKKKEKEKRVPEKSRREWSAVEGQALSRKGKLGWKVYAVAGAGAVVAAVTLAIVNAPYDENANIWQKAGPATLESLRVLLRVPILLGIGMLAFAMTAWATGVRAGRADLAAARLGVAVALAVMALEIQLAFFGARVVVYALALGLYFLVVWMSFRCPPREAGLMLGLHAALFAAIAGLGWLIVWVGL